MAKAASKKTLAYWRENIKQSMHIWGLRETIVALIIYVLGLLFWFGYVPDKVSNPLMIALGVVIVSWFPALVLVVTPRKMWMQAQDQIAELKADLERINIVLEYEPELAGFQLFNESAFTAYKVNIPSFDEPPFYVKWEVEPDTIPARTYRKVTVSAYRKKDWKKISTVPKQIIKTVWKDRLSEVDRTSLSPEKSEELIINLLIIYSNVRGDEFQTKYVMKFDCFTEQIKIELLKT
jgi:hypothetical protein